VKQPRAFEGPVWPHVNASFFRYLLFNCKAAKEKKGMVGHGMGQVRITHVSVRAEKPCRRYAATRSSR
jgi:hypothetical protein